MTDSLICIDASFLVRLVTSFDNEKPAQLVDSWLNDRRQLIAPTLLYYEVTNALYLYARVGQMDQVGVLKALRAVLALPIELHGGPELHVDAVAQAGKYGLGAVYDAHYLALAERLGADLWTADGRLARTVQSALPWVHLL